MTGRERRLPSPSDNRKRNTGPLNWWLPGSFALLWRFPVLMALVICGLWFLLRALVHVAFLYDQRGAFTFLLAPIILPFAAVPPACFWVCYRGLPWVWRQSKLDAAQRAATALLSLPVALVAATTIDLLQINIIHLLGVHLPRLPLDPF